MPRVAKNKSDDKKKKGDSRHKSSFGKMVGGYLGGKLGRTFGGKAGQETVSRFGSYLGGHAQDLFRRLTGFGDYQVSGNSFVHGEQPAIFTSRSHGHRIRHREFVQDITSSSSAFSVTSLSISPTSPMIFSWLAPLANQYEQYRIRGMVMEYVPLSGNISSTQALGYVCIASEMDSNKPAPISKAQLNDYEFSVQKMPCESMLHPYECDPRETSVPILYTSPNGNPLATENLNFVNFCNTYIATGGQSANGIILGSVYLSYDIEFFKPRPSIAIVPPAVLHWNLNSSGTASPMGSSQTLLTTSYSSQLKPEQVTLTAATITLTGIPVGSYIKVDHNYQGTAAVIGTFSSSVTPTGAVAQTWFFNNAFSNIQSPAATVSSTNVYAGMVWKATSSTIVLTYSAGPLIPTAMSQAGLIISLLQ